MDMQRRDEYKSQKKCFITKLILEVMFLCISFKVTQHGFEFMLPLIIFLILNKLMCPFDSQFLLPVK